jgi:predicted DNA-binding protein (UPF0251 family)
MITAVIPDLTAVAMFLEGEREEEALLVTPECPTTQGLVPGQYPDEYIPADPGIWLYRERTVAILRTYARLSVEVGRLPSLLGREFFRARVTSYKASTFEDTVIFVHDVERTLEKLDRFEQELVAVIVLEEYSREEAARLMNCGIRTIERRLPEALDKLSETFLEGGILTKLVDPKNEPENSCQEGQACGKVLSCWDCRENNCEKCGGVSPVNVIF